MLLESSTLRIRLLGELDLRYGGGSLPPLGSARVASLLAYLLLHRQAPQPRQRIAFLLWPDSTERQARTNLRHLLHNLRLVLPDPDAFLDITPLTLRWRADTRFWLDVAAFEELVSHSKRDVADEDETVASLRKGVGLYTGDLLEGCYDEWIAGERERLRQCHVEALERLTALLEARGDHTQAIRYAERLLRQDPLREETYRLLIRLHDVRGDRARALRVYHICAATLDRELGVEPSTETRETYEALLPLVRGPAAGDRRARPPTALPLVGRAREWTRLTTLWRAIETGNAPPQLVLLTGEPGIGKTRLAEELCSWCAHRGVVTAVARSYAAEGTLAYGSLVQWLRSEPLEGRRERLPRSLVVELARLLPDLPGGMPDGARSEGDSERDRRQRLFDAAARVILASGGPTLLVADDLHWCDQETLQFLHYLLRVEPDARLLVVATARPEEIGRHALYELLAGLRALERVAEIEVGRLTRDATTALAEQITGHSLEERSTGQLFAETEGNPLFVVEAIRAGWVSGRAARGSLAPKVQAVIEARLAQLSPAAVDLVGVAATIGREFTADVLARASEASEDLLVRALDELWRRRIVREQGADAYDFTHERIREVAYGAMSSAHRRRHHLHVARALEALHARDLGPVSGQIAGHYERAGAAADAVAWYEEAADAAQQLYANAEAVRLLSRALDLLRTTAETSERDARELSIITALSAPLASVEGYASSRLADVQQRALDLARARRVEPAPPLLRSVALTSLSLGDFERAQQVGAQLSARGRRDADEVLGVESEYVLGIASFWRGELHAARAHFEAAVNRYRPEHAQAHLFRYGQDPKVICLSRLANTLLFLGRPAAAVRSCDAALASAVEIGHPHSHATALVFAALLFLERRDPARLRECEAALAMAVGREETASRQTQVGAEAFGGYVDVLDGRQQAGIGRLRRALDDLLGAEHAPGMRAIILRLLLEACAGTSNVHAGLEAAERALQMGGAACLWEAEVRRLRAGFLAALGAPPADVEAELERALQVARRQGARLLELRTATSLLRHRLDRGDRSGEGVARDLVAAIAATLPEGGDTPDLRAAAAMLALR